MIRYEDTEAALSQTANYFLDFVNSSWIDPGKWLVQ